MTVFLMVSFSLAATYTHTHGGDRFSVVLRQAREAGHEVLLLEKG